MSTVPMPPGGEVVDEFPVAPAVTEPPQEDTEPESHSLAEMLATGATYRQLDYWARRGWLTSDNPGSGHARRWTPRDRAVAHLMVRLGETGLRTDVAARVAADAADHGIASYSSEWGVTIMWRPMPVDQTPPIDRRNPA